MARRTDGGGAGGELDDAPWVLKVIRKHFPWLGSKWVLIVVGAIGTVTLYEGFRIPVINGVIDQKDETIRTISEQRDTANRETESLEKKVEQLRIYRGQDAPPLKTKAEIFVRQVKESIQGWKDSDPPETQERNVHGVYLTRFGLRAQILRDDLDQFGFQSNELDGLIYGFTGTYKEVRRIVAEIDRFAKQIPGESP